MGNTNAEKSTKVRRTYRIEESLLKDLEQMERLTGQDFTATIHRAVRTYKRSPQFKAEIARRQKEHADSVAEFTDPNASKVGNAGKVQAIVKKAAARAPRVPPPSK